MLIVYALSYNLLVLRHNLNGERQNLYKINIHRLKKFQRAEGRPAGYRGVELGSTEKQLQLCGQSET